MCCCCLCGDYTNCLIIARQGIKTKLQRGKKLIVPFSFFPICPCAFSVYFCFQNSAEDLTHFFFSFLCYKLKSSPVFEFVPVASHPFTGHAWKVPGSTLSVLSLLVLVYIDEIPQIPLFSRLSSPSSLTFPRRSPFIILMAPDWALPS